MNETRRPWTSAEKATLFAAGDAVARHRQAARLARDRHRSGAQRKAAQALYYQLFAAHTRIRIRAPAALVSPPSQRLPTSVPAVPSPV